MKNKDDIIVYSNGIIYCSVCVPKDYSKKDIELGVNRLHPTGISSSWKISKEPFKDSDKNPLPCEQNKRNRLHYLMFC